MAISSTGKQHVNLYQKLLLRRGILTRFPVLPGTALYLPYCGDGDLARECYADREADLYAADLDPLRVDTFRSRFPSATVKVADVEQWPFAEKDRPFGLADFDAFGNPYLSVLSFWKAAKLSSRIVLFGTDGNLQTINRQRRLVEIPTNTGPVCRDVNTVRRHYNFWWTGHVLPWLMALIEGRGGKVAYKQMYRRGSGMIYGGIVVER